MSTVLNKGNHHRLYLCRKLVLLKIVEEESITTDINHSKFLLNQLVLIRSFVSEDDSSMTLIGSLLECYGSPVVSLGNPSGLMLWTVIKLLTKELG